MKQVTMYKCSCGELGTEIQIKKCEARHVKWAAENKERINLFKRISTFKTKLRKSASSIQEIETKIMEFSKKISPKYYIEELRLDKMSWNNNCSNIHGCPLKVLPTGVVRKVNQRDIPVIWEWFILK